MQSHRLYHIKASTGKRRAEDDAREVLRLRSSVLQDVLKKGSPAQTPFRTSLRVSPISQANDASRDIPDVFKSDARTKLAAFFSILLIAIWVGRPTSWRGYTVHRTWRREPGGALRSWLCLGVVAFRQRLIDHCLNLRVGQFGVFLSKHALKDWTSGGNIAFPRLA